MNMLNLRFKRVEQLTGLSEKQIKNLSPEEYRTYLEKRSGKQLRIISELPTIGRGNVLRDNFITRSALNKEIDDIIGQE